MRKTLERLLMAVSSLIADGRISTRSGRPAFSEADIQVNGRFRVQTQPAGLEFL